MVKLDLAYEQIDPSRIPVHRIFLDISDRRLAMNDNEASHIFLTVDSRRVLRDYLVKAQCLVGPPFHHVRSVQPPMHQLQIAAVQFAKTNHLRSLSFYPQKDMAVFPNVMLEPASEDN